MIALEESLMSDAPSSGNQQKWSELVMRASRDAELKQRLLSNPTPVLQEAGIEVPAGANVHVTEENDRMHCTIEAVKAAAAAAGASELTPADLASVAGGADIVARKAGEKPLEFLKIKMTQVFVTSY